MNKKRTITLDVTHLSEQEIDELKRAFTASAQEQPQSPVKQDTKQDISAMPYVKWSVWRKKPENKGKTVFDFWDVAWKEAIESGATQADIRKKDKGYFNRLVEVLYDRSDLEKSYFLPPSKKRRPKVEDPEVEKYARQDLGKAYKTYLFVARNMGLFEEFRNG